jgi:hypothetical protein
LYAYKVALAKAKMILLQHAQVAQSESISQTIIEQIKTSNSRSCFGRIKLSKNISF